MAMRRKTNRRTKRLKNRAQGLKSSHFTRKGTKQVYGKGPQGRKSFPHGILTSEDNYGGYQVYTYGIQCEGADGGDYSQDCQCWDNNNCCERVLKQCDENGGEGTVYSSNNNSGGYNIPKNYPIGFVSLGAELFGVGIDCYLPNGQGYSLECTQQSTSNINDGCNHEVQDCEDNFGGSATLVVG